MIHEWARGRQNEFEKCGKSGLGGADAEFDGHQ